MNEAGGASRAWAVLRTLAMLAFASLYWLSRSIFPGQSDYAALDRSWSQGTADAYKRGLQAGVDWLFTSGPLGWIVSGTYDPTLIVERLVLGEGLFKGLIALILTASALRIPGKLDRALFLLALLIAPPNIDAQVLLMILAVGTWLAQSPRPSPWLTTAAYTALALACMVKFTFFLAANFTLAMVILAFLARRDRRTALRLSVAWLIATTCIWIACGQELWNLPVYVFRSLGVALGYPEAMSTVPSSRTEALAFGLLAVVGVLFAAAARLPRARSGRHVAHALGLGLVYVAYQAGFVRGNDHTDIFFCFAIAAPFLIVPDAGTDRVSRLAFPALRAIGVGLALLGLTTKMPMTDLGLHFARFTNFQRESLRNLRGCIRNGDSALAAARQTWDLPRTRELVGDATIDMISYEQGLLFLNGLNWHPRPMIQGYSAYTPSLSRLNGEFMAGGDAPRFVLFRLQSIDERLRTQDDALALEVLLRDYEPRLVERHWVLYEQARRTGLPGKREVVYATRAAFEETVELPPLSGSVHVLELDIGLTLRGELLGKLTRPPAIWMEVECTDGFKRRFRLVPGLMREGAIIDPVLADDDDWVGWITGEPQRRPKMLRLRVDPRLRSWVQGDAALRLRRADDLAPTPVPGIERTRMWSMLRDEPTSVDSSLGASPGLFRGEHVVVVHTPARISYSVDPGRYRLTLKYGILDGAAKAGSDGVVFRAGLDDGNGQVRGLFEQALGLERSSPDPEMQSSTIEFETDEAARLILTTDPGPMNLTFFDWAFWRDVRLDRIGDPR